MQSVIHLLKIIIDLSFYFISSYGAIVYFNLSLVNSNQVLLYKFFLVSMVKGEGKGRQFFGLMEKVGSWNRYQFYMIATFAYTSILQASFMFIPPYLFHQSQYQCQGMSSEQCSNYVCTLQNIQREQYLPNSPFLSLADDLGNFRCENQSTLPLLQSIIFISTITGMITLTFFTEQIGRKNSFAFTSTCTLIGFMVVLLSNNITVLILALLITLMGTENGNQFTNCIPTEIISEEKRVKSILFQNLFYPVGIMVNALAFNLFHDWKAVIVIFYIIPAFLLFLSALFIFQKTPIDLLKSQSPARIIQILGRIQVMNQIKESKLTESYVRNLQVQYNQSLSDDHSGYFNIFDIFKYKSLRTTFAPLVGNLFVAIYLFTSPAMVCSASTTEQIYLNNIISGVSYIVSVVLLYYITQVYQRRTIISFILLAEMLITAVMLLDFVKNYQSAINVLFFIYRVMVSGFIQLMYIINYESYPAQIRAAAALFSCALGMSSGIIQPWIVQYANSSKLDVRWSFMVLGLLGLWSNYLLKQTFNTFPGQLIEQLQPREKEEII